MMAMKDNRKDGVVARTQIKPVSALSMYHQRKKKDNDNTMPPHLNLLLSSKKNDSSQMTDLRNCYSNGGIVEISGEAGSGKTQICLSACVSCASTPWCQNNANDNNNTNGVSFTPPRKTDVTLHNSNNIKPISTIVKKIYNPYKKTKSLSPPKPVTKNSQTPKNPYSHPSIKHMNNDIHKYPQENSFPKPTDNNYHAKNRTYNHSSTFNPNERNFDSINNDDNAQNDYKGYYNSMYVSMGEGTTQQQIGQRLNQMVSERFHHRLNENHDEKTSSGVSNTDEIMHQKRTLLERIIIKQLHNEEDVTDFICHELPNMLSSHIKENKIGLIVLDSIAGIYRSQEQVAENYYVQRSNTFFQIATQLKKISHQYGVHILVVNQVTSSSSSINDNSSTLIPSLGLSWSNCVNTRYSISRNNSLRSKVTSPTSSSSSSTNYSVRTLKVLASSSIPSDKVVHFQIEKCGCRYVQLND